jgi:hypothetical protein
MLDINDPAVARRIAAMVETIELRTGRELDEAALERTQQNLLRYLNQIAALDAVDLANGDEPDFRFVAYRAEG